MKRLLMLLLLVSLPAFGGQPVGPLRIDPVPVDMKDVNIVWEFLKKELHAPDEILPPVLVVDWKVPAYGRMGTQFPTEQFPDNRIQISIAPRTIDMWEPQMVSFGIGHEMTHYLFILRENQWDDRKKIYTVLQKHHCDPEFQKVTRDVADKLWSVWHDETLRQKMYDEVVKSCANFPHQ